MTKKTTAKTTAVGALVPQPNGGALRNGGTNAGGTGRPSSELRRRLKEAGADRIKVLEEIADSKEVKESDRIKAIDMMLKYGLGKQVPRDAVVEFLKAATALVAEHVEDQTTLDQIKAGWIDLLRSHFT